MAFECSTAFKCNQIYIKTVSTPNGFKDFVPSNTGKGGTAEKQGSCLTNTADEIDLTAKMMTKEDWYKINIEKCSEKQQMDSVLVTSTMVGPKFCTETFCSALLCALQESMDDLFYGGYSVTQWRKINDDK